MPVGFPDTFDARQHRPMQQAPEQTGWGNPFEAAIAPVKPSFEETIEDKKSFGIELAKNPQFPFQAASNVFKDTSVALWASRNWLSDPEVIAARDLYLETIELNKPILDKQQLAAKVMQEIDAKTPDGRPLIDAKDRAAMLKLYAEIAGHIGKGDGDNSGKTFIHNHMTVKLVRATPIGKEQIKEIEHTSIEDDDEIIPLPITVKRVSSSR